MKIDDESDQTGDSGMGSGSGATKYGTIKEWKEAIQNPPPGMYRFLLLLYSEWSFCVDTHEHGYQSIMVETTDTGMWLFVQSFYVVN